MGKKTELKSVNIIIQPVYRKWTSCGDRPDPTVVQNWWRAASDLEKLLKRRLDDDDYESITTDAVAEYTCEHCGGEWTETSTTYNGGCCDEDEKGNPNA